MQRSACPGAPPPSPSFGCPIHRGPQPQEIFFRPGSRRRQPVPLATCALPEMLMYFLRQKLLLGTPHGGGTPIPLEKSCVGMSHGREIHRGKSRVGIARGFGTSTPRRKFRVGTSHGRRTPSPLTLWHARRKFRVGTSHGRGTPSPPTLRHARARAGPRHRRRHRRRRSAKTVFVRTRRERRRRRGRRCCSPRCRWPRHRRHQRWRRASSACVLRRRVLPGAQGIFVQPQRRRRRRRRRRRHRRRRGRRHLPRRTALRQAVAGADVAAGGYSRARWRHGRRRSAAMLFMSDYMSFLPQN